MTLYISGTLNTFAIFDEDKYDQFDNLTQNIQELSKKYNLYVDRCSINDGCDFAFVIHSQNKRYQSFYSGECFEVDMSIADDENFSERVSQFLKEFNTIPEFSEFHNLVFNTPKKRYFVIS